MKRAVAAAILLVAAPASAEETAEPEEDHRPALAVLAGAGVATASLAAGTIVVTQSDDLYTRNRGVLAAQAGLVLAPIVAHVVVKELGRGALFALVPLAGQLAMGALFTAHPQVLDRGEPPVQYTFAGSLVVSILGAAIGVYDASRAGHRLTPVPLVDRGTFGLGFGGTL